MVHPKHNFTAETSRLAYAGLALQFSGHAFISSPKREECFDSAALLTALTGEEISGDWMETGDRLPFEPIPTHKARVGDVVVIDLSIRSGKLGGPRRGLSVLSDEPADAVLQTLQSLISHTVRSKLSDATWSREFR